MIILCRVCRGPFRLMHGPVGLLVTNLRLGAFNGLHLVYLAALGATHSRAVVYTEHADGGLGREV